MDDTQQSRVSDAASTRKRRSSILKSQRPARTPFSELEFNVATPTDTAKSRRVSFSRRTGVAEFVTNEATTTWKNFYEEHNKSLESSGNDSEAHATRQPVEHLGKRIFDQQFEEVEAVDFIGSLNPSPNNGSLNNVNFAQLASLDCTSDGKLTAPLNKFELSALPDQQSKIFGNDFTMPCTGEMSGRIDINFSDLQQIGADKDDLDEIQKDIARASNLVCHGPFGRPDISEYIEVDLNMTHVATRNEEDMSITDTIHSPKVQDLSKSVSIDKKINPSKDWITDKENIAINPYAAPRETDNFAINEEPDQVLVFDGKRLTIQTEKTDDRNKDFRQTLLPTSSSEMPQRKTIVLNMDDDLPNFVDDMGPGYNSGQNSKSNTMHNNDMSMTVTVNRMPKRNTCHDLTGNISITQALPTNIIIERELENQETDMMKTIVYEDNSGNISVTQALPAAILNNTRSNERRRTVVFENDTGNMSITKSVPQNIILDESTKNQASEKTDTTTVLIENAGSNISVTSNKISSQNKRKTIVFDDESGNISITQALPPNIVLSDKQSNEKRRTIIFKDDTGDISVTQALPNLILGQKEERRRTVVYDDGTGNISVTQALPTNIIQDIVENKKSNDSKIISSKSYTICNKDVTKRNTIVYEDDTGNISITQALPTKVLSGYNENELLKTPKATEEYEFNVTTKSKTKGKKQITIMYDNDDEVDISMTQAVPTNIIVPNKQQTKRNTLVFDNEEADISVTQAIATNILLSNLDAAFDEVDQENIRRKLIEENEKIADETEVVIKENMYEQDGAMAEVQVVEKPKSLLIQDEKCAEMSITEALTNIHDIVQQDTEKRKTVLFDNANGNISITKPIPADILTFQNDILIESKNKKLDVLESKITNPCPDLLVYQAATDANSPILSDRTEQGDLKSDQQVRSTKNSEIKLVSSSVISEEVKMPENELNENSTTDEGVQVDCKDISTESISMQDDVVSADQSIKHPPVEEKTDVLDFKISNVTVSLDVPASDLIVKKESSEADHSLQATEPSVNTTEINNLPDMTNDSTVHVTEEKNVMVQLDSNSSVSTQKKAKHDRSIDSIFYIIKDSDDETQPDFETQPDVEAKAVSVGTKTPIPLEYKTEETVGLVDNLVKKLDVLQTQTSDERNESLCRIYETIAKCEQGNVTEKDENVILREQSLRFMKANDTNELLAMMSDFTSDDGEEAENVVAPSPKPRSSMISRKSEIVEPKRLSFAPRRQSIVLSREDMLNNISMAHAVLQKSRIELDETDIDDTENTLDISTNKKANRSSDVVKTLHFDDESSSDVTFKADKTTPLKKTVFGETAYMSESKAKVIPTYLKDVSDGIKELMLDLVKPMADNLPFDSSGVEKPARKVPSTQSTHVQANLITSSQTDMDPDLCGPNPYCDMNRMKSQSQSFRSSVRFSTTTSAISSDYDMVRQECSHNHELAILPEPKSPSKVLVFDHLNPLNNILLGGMDYNDSHRYNPQRSEETICERKSAQLQIKENDSDIDNISTQYRMECKSNPIKQAFITMDENRSKFSIDKSVLNVDQCVDAKIIEVKDSEMNTVIVMKGNSELLEASSSLTLVDDTVASKSSCGVGIKSPDINAVYSGHRKVKISRSPVEVIYKIEEQGNVQAKAETDTSPTDEDIEKTQNKPKKRIYSPTKSKYNRNLIDVTPKPTSKMQKISNSPKPYKDTKIPAEKDFSDATKPGSPSSRLKSPRKSKSPKSGADMTVQQLITQYKIEASIDKTMDKKILAALYNKSESSATPASTSEAECNSLDEISSFTSSKQLMKELSGVSTRLSTSTRASQQSGMQIQQSRDWHPDLMSALSSKNLNLNESVSGVNVVAKIDMLPFMGSHECEWESSSGDTWAFRLLHGRLRLSARLAHRHENSARTRVRGDTPVLDVGVETVQLEKKNPVATLCVRFACETMRYMVSRVCRSKCTASDIPPLLRRCAAVARVALRWGRAMHDAKLHLAYTLDNDGHLTLKVANIPLRSVWEVRMHIELVVEDAREAPWPRATDVQVARVVSDVIVPEHDVKRALASTPRDWGHAPRTIWRIFRYLKNKTRDDDLLLQ